MDGPVIAALITAVAAVIIAAGGWVATARMRLPSKMQKAIRDETEKYESTLEGKVTRLENELATEKADRANDKEECGQRIDDLIDGMIERDLVIAGLHRRLGIPPPTTTTPAKMLAHHS